MFYVLSQNREKLYNMNGHIEGIGYEESHVYKRTARGKKTETTIHHTLQVYDGCAEEIAEYATKEDCLKVLRICAIAISNNTEGNAVYEMPTQEELPEIVKVYDRLHEMYERAAGQANDELKEAFDILNEGGGV